MSAGALPGFRDFYPETFAQRSWLFDHWREAARGFGFVEYDGPPLEPLDLYTRKSGDEIVGQLYNFTDKGGREISLRPEMTPTVARMVAARANALRKPVRWFSMPQLFRYERQQKGRLREHFQLNVDIFGEADVAADAELLAVACTVMRRVGLGPDDVKARVSDRRLLAAVLHGLGIAEAATPAVFAAVDKIGRDDDAALVKRMRDAGVEAEVAGRVLDTVRASDFDALARDFAGNADVEAALARFAEYRALLDAHGVLEYLQLDLGIVRGLAYYTGIVFELFDARGEFRAICGGGRYDNLLKALGGVDMPALGFGMGDVVLGELIVSRLAPGETPPWASANAPDIWLAAPEGEPLAGTIRAARALRECGLRVEYPLRPMSSSKQRKAAWSSAARYLLEPEGASADRQYRVKAVAERATPQGQGLAQQFEGRTATIEEIVAAWRTGVGGATDRP
ncbi:MAG: ATP phosphoribosyltransferase regulatory subunit [Gemmatimonadetes bacterium]|nr:ATP phosphoribosyltransferase regulatory subunit [Gemmatimonadota bacterium]